MPQAIYGYVLECLASCCRCSALLLQLQCSTVSDRDVGCMACSKNSLAEASAALMSSSPTVQKLFGCETNTVPVSAEIVPAAAHVTREPIAW